MNSKKCKAVQNNAKAMQSYVKQLNSMQELAHVAVDGYELYSATQRNARR